MSVRRDRFLPCVAAHAGAHFSDEEENGPVLDFGNVDAELRAVTGGCFLHDAPATGFACVSGEAGLKLLRRLLTADAACFPRGSAFRAAMLNASGGIMLGARVVAGTDSWELLFPAEAADAGQAWTRQVAVAFDAEVSVPGDRHAFWMGGPGMARVAALAGIPVPPPGKALAAGDGADPVTLAGFPGMSLVIGSTAAADRLWRALEGAGAVPVGEQGWDLARVLSCLPALRQDYDESSSPVESGFEACVDFRDASRMFIGRALTEARARSGVRCRMGVLEIDDEIDPAQMDCPPEATTECSDSEGVLVTTWARGCGKSYALALLPASAKPGDRVDLRVFCGGADRACAGRVFGFSPIAGECDGNECL